MGKKKKQQIRAQFRKNRSVRARRTDWTREFEQHGFEQQDPAKEERISGKGELTRQRTVCGTAAEEGEEPGLGIHLDVDSHCCRPGRVLCVQGLNSTVEAEDGTLYQCATRRLLKTLSTDQRHVVAVGDRVAFRVVENSDARTREGLIERVEPRHGSICRTSRGRQHVLVANVDQVLIITSAAEPRIKPNLIDRLLITAEKSGVRPVVCINKCDLIEPAGLAPLVGTYSQMGYDVLLVSAVTGFGLDRLRRRLTDRQSVVTGQSGVGKSSLLNRIDPSLDLRISAVSADTQKGRHTTTNARLIRLCCGGYVVDTPGIRQFELWDVIPEEVAGYFRDLHPYVNLCRFPDCTHTHEEDCAIKDAVADGRLDERRYESYCHLFTGDLA
ncbi:MAG TPA: ribosome small subunit-dependent GTPase A [Planctomycetaceae bacterium]|nr:ribosome small subunit-dependent GTPase A [Planctomycetaceae bacterium]